MLWLAFLAPMAWRPGHWRSARRERMPWLYVLIVYIGLVAWLDHVTP